MTKPGSGVKVDDDGVRLPGSHIRQQVKMYLFFYIAFIKFYGGFEKKRAA